MRGPAGPRMSRRRCARWRRSSAPASRRIPAGTVSNDSDRGGPLSMTDTPAVAAPDAEATEPCGDLSIRTLAMPADTNQNGDIFGGWLLSQMDIAGGIFAAKTVKLRT